MKNYLLPMLFALFFISYLSALFAQDTIHLDTSGTITHAQFVKDSIAVTTGGAIVSQYVGAKYVPLIGLLVLIIMAVLQYLQHTNIKKLVNKTTVILLITGLLTGLSGCTGTTHLFTANGVTIKEQIGKQGLYMEEYAVVHTSPLQFDTAAYLIVMPDSLANTLFNDIKSYIAGKIPGIASALKPVAK